MSLGNTGQALKNITDAGLFERLATAILREANPLYQSLVHTGVNAEGKPIKSPVDGICFVKGANPPHMVAVHHATTAQKDLEKKWLHDPSTVKPRKGSKPTAPAGDLIKTAAIAQQEREGITDLRVSLILTTNREPSEDLVRSVAAAGRTYDIEIDIWSCSRLSHFLDYQPTGQWIRKSFLDIEQELLSPDLLHEISIKSLEIQQNKFFDNPNTWIPRQLDSLLNNALNRNMTFLVAGSGFGKSVACFRQLSAHIEKGGFGLILSHDTVASSLTLEQAVMSELKRLHPSLTFGTTPASLCSSEKPLLLVVEDINRSGEAQALLSKLASWNQESSEPQQRKIAYWRVLCPLWPEIFASLPTQTRKAIQEQALIDDGFTEDEGKEAVLTWSHLENHNISPLEAQAVAHALGNDPLLINLHNREKTPDVNQIIEQFVEDCLEDIRQIVKDFFLASYHQAIRALGSEMLSRCKIDLVLSEVITWERLQGQHLQLLSRLVDHGKFIRVIGSSDNQRLIFRHDRVRDWILADAVIDLESRGILEEEILSEPYFAEVIGAAIIKGSTSSSFVENAKSFNPLALFHALRIIGDTERPNRDSILGAIDDCLTEPTISEPSKLHFRLEALAMLSETDAPEVPEIAEKLHQDHPLNAAAAKLRNGDIFGGINLCSIVDPGHNYPWRDSQIEHAKNKYGHLLTEALSKILQRTNLTSQDKIGALRLSGHLAESNLALAIEASWNADDDRFTHLSEYLWAFAECCADDPKRFLEPVCDAWASLSAQPEKEGYPSPRTRLAAHEIRWAFRTWPPHPAIDYFIQRATQEDLKWPITYMLHGMDHPKAIEFVVKEFAENRRQIEGTDFVVSMQIEDEWRRAQESGHPMSKEGRELLYAMWQNSDNDKYLRSQAFTLWAATRESYDLEVLRDKSCPGDILADSILRARLVRGDQQAVPDFLEKLDSNQTSYWWYYGHHVYSPVLTDFIDKKLSIRGADSKVFLESNFGFDEDLKKAEAYKTESINLALSLSGNAQKPACTNLDSFISNIIIRLPQDEAHSLLLKHWEHLRFSPYFIQTALYIATPELLQVVHVAICDCPEPQNLFMFLSQRFGIREIGHPGIHSESQLHALAPYLHFLDPFCIYCFWQECNDRGWFAIRRELFDNHLHSEYVRFKWEPNQAKASLDEMLEKDRLVWLEHWIDGFLKIDVSWEDVLSTIHGWFEEKHSFEAFKALASAIQYRGSREDLSILKVHESLPEPDTSQLISDTVFAVKRRSIR